MKSLWVLIAMFTAASLVSAYSEQLFPFMHRRARRAGHQHHHKKHADLPAVKRHSQCQFPTDVGLVPVTPDQQNAGWAMSPNQPCLPGNYCPYACPSGQVMAQWDPAATSYTYPISMYGGLYCDTSGTISKPFPDQPYCVDGVGNFLAVNEASDHVAICQTVLPGNEAMLIPNLVGGNSQLTLAVPDPSYWCSTSAEYYVNIPGYDTETACVWGDSSNPYGNWAPFVTGANQASDGNTYVMVGINPIYCCQADSFAGIDPGFAIRIDCPSGNCNGMPCECNPATMGPNSCTGGTVGAGGAQFCTVTVPSGGSAQLVIFSTSNGSVISSSSLSQSQSRDVVYAPAPPSSPKYEQPPSPARPASASDDDCTMTTSSYWTTGHTASAVSAYSQPPGPYSSSKIQAAPSGGGLKQNQVYPSSSNSASATSSPISQSSPLVQVTSGSDRAVHTSKLLCVMAVIALGMVNL